MRTYDRNTELVFAATLPDGKTAIGHFSEVEFARLGLAALDQAGLSEEQQLRVRQVVHERFLQSVLEDAS